MNVRVIRLWAYSISSYSALVALGIFSGLVYVAWLARIRGLGWMQVLDGALWSLAFGLSGARLAYVLLNPADYVTYPPAILTRWGGGLDYQGGLLAGLVGLWVFARRARLPFLQLLDLATPGVALAQAFAWVGAPLQGVYYGVALRFPLSQWLPDLHGVYGPRFPTQLLALLMSVCLLANLHRFRSSRLRQGTLGLSYLLVSSGGFFALEFALGDDAIHLGLLRFTQWVELAELAAAATLLWLLWRPRTTHDTSKRVG